MVGYELLVDVLLSDGSLGILEDPVALDGRSLVQLRHSPGSPMSARKNRAVIFFP